MSRGQVYIRVQGGGYAPWQGGGGVQRAQVPSAFPVSGIAGMRLRDTPDGSSPSAAVAGTSPMRRVVCARPPAHRSR